MLLLFLPQINHCLDIIELNALAEKQITALSVIKNKGDQLVVPTLGLNMMSKIYNF